MTLSPIDPQTLKRRLDAGEAILIDIREHDEHAREHILGARLAPLSAIDAHDFDRDHGKIAVFHCKSGMRTQANAARLIAKGFREAYFLEGGLEAWKAAGLPVWNQPKPAP
jgi:rhodanese-related sulfurtransferase